MKNIPIGNKNYEISWKSIFWVVATALVVYLFFYFSGLLLILLTVLVLSVSLSPIVDKLKNILHLPRIVAVFLLFVVIIAVIVFAAYTIIPPTIEEFRTIYHSLPEYGKNALPFLQSSGSSASGGGSMGNIFNSILDVVFILVLTFLLLIEEGGLVKYITSLIPIKEKVYAITVGKKISNKIGSWFSGQILIMLIIGVVNFLAFWAVGIPYAMALGVLAFIFESVPNIGPVLAAVPAIALAYIDAPWKAAYVLVFTVLLHLLSNQFLVPKIMGKLLSISAFVIVLGLIIGGELAGITGMILALPIIATMQVLAQEWPNLKSKEGFLWQKK